MKLAIVLTFLFVLSLSTTILEAHQWALSNTLKLRLNYAAREGKPLATSSFKVIWNGKIVKEITPANYNVNQLSLSLVAKVGKNQIKFAGAGASDSFGATITDIRLLRPSCCHKGKENLIVNGDFEEGHNLGKGWKIFKGQFYGWKGQQIQIGYGKIYNKQWEEGTYVSELDPNKNTQISQDFTFDKYYRFDEHHDHGHGHGHPHGKLILHFDYANRENVPFDSQGFSVYWNNQKIKTISTKDYKIHHVAIPVTAKVGANTLKLSAEGKSDSLGTTVTHVKLLKGKKDLLVNGNFEQPAVGKGWHIYPTIPGWTGGQVEVGWGRIYNKLWPESAHVVELDANANTNVIQTLNLDEHFNRK